jgi:hypothetical protein
MNKDLWSHQKLTLQVDEKCTNATQVSLWLFFEFIYKLIPHICTFERLYIQTGVSPYLPHFLTKIIFEYSFFIKQAPFLII